MSLLGWFSRRKWMVCVRSWKAEKGSVERQRGDKRKKKSTRKCRIPCWSLNHSCSRKQNLHRKASLKQETHSEIRNLPQDPRVLLTLLSSLGGHAKTDRREISEKKSRGRISFWTRELKTDNVDEETSIVWCILSSKVSMKVLSHENSNLTWNEYIFLPLFCSMFNVYIFLFVVIFCSYNG